MLKYRGVNRTGKTMGEGKKCLMKRNAMRGQKMRTVAPLKWSGNGGTLTRGRERNAYSEWSSRVTLVDTQWAISLQWLGTSPNIIFHYDARRVLPDNKISFRIYGNAVAKWLARGITNRFDLSHTFFHVYGPPPSPLSLSPRMKNWIRSRLVREISSSNNLDSRFTQLVYIYLFKANFRRDNKTISSQSLKKFLWYFIYKLQPGNPVLHFGETFIPRM